MKNGRKDPPPAAPKRSLWPFICVILLLMGGVAAVSQIPFVFRLKTKNGSFLASNYQMEEDSFSDPRLRVLRHHERLDQVVSSGKTQFDKIVLLRHWVHQQWETHPTFYYPAWDAEEILDLARRAHNGGFCAQYAI